MTDSEHTDFGFEDVPPDEKTRLVRAVFESVAPNYDRMNDLMSLGLHRLWKRQAVAVCDIRPGQQVLDLAGGTGDLTRLIYRQLRGKGRIILSDINEPMINRGRDRLLDEGIVDSIDYVLADAARLPFADCSFHRACIGFGLRNVTDKPAALRSVFDCLHYGGMFVILEFSHLALRSLKPLYDAYSFHWLPWLGRQVAQDESSYRYLAESIRRHPDQETLAGWMREAGFARVEYFNLAGGIVAIHRGFKI